jgi:hypothetical protein
MSRWRLLPAFLLACVVMAGLFGVLHDQISYSVSPEYYTQFKFRQFHLLDLALPERVRAGIVGFLACWWMGIPLGAAVFAMAWRQPTLLSMRKALWSSLPIMAGVTLAISLLGLAWGWWHVTLQPREAWPRWYIPPGVQDARAFVTVGCMHAAAYAGGVLSVLAVWFSRCR